MGSGNDAVAFSGAGTMVVDPGATFVGTVQANTSDTIELAGSTAASLSGFGSQIAGLGTLVFDLGAQWTVTGNGTGLADGQVLSGFASGDTIDLTGVGTETTVTPGGGDAEILSGPGATSATLAFAAALPVGDGLALAPDGTGGTLAWLVQTTTPSISAPSAATVGINQPDSLGTITIAETTTSSSETFTLTLSDTLGTLSANTGAVGGGGTITPSNGGETLTISGSLTQVNADLTTLAEDEPATTPDTVSYSLSDSNGGTATPISTTVTVNSVPSISATTPIAAVQGQAAAIPVTVSESGDTSAETFTVAVTDTAATLSATTSVTNGGGTITPSNGGDTLTFVGSLTQVNADFSTLSDTPLVLTSQTITVAASDSLGNTAIQQAITVTVSPPSNNTFDAHVYLDANGDGGQDNGESGLAGVTVDLLDGSGNPTGQSMTTDASGDVSFTGLTPGAYQIHVVPPIGDGVSQATNTDTSNTLSGGQSATATEGVYVPASFSVHVYDDVNADGVQDTGDSDLPGVTVDLLTGSGAPTGKSETTDANGDVSFTGLAPGSYQVQVETPTGDATTQTTNTLTSNTLASGGSASATEGVYAPPALTEPTLSLTVAEGQSLGNIWSLLLANGVDPDPSSLTVSAVGMSGTEGFVALDTADQSVTYLASGVDPTHSIDLFTYTLTDGAGGTVTGTADVTITGPNLPTTVVATPLATITATGSGQRLDSEGVGEVLIGSPAGGDRLFGDTTTTIEGQGSGNTIFVEPGDHVVNMGANDNTLTLHDGNNQVTASGTGDTVLGGDGNDTVTGMTGGATITLGNGNDSVIVSGADNTITVGTGSDVVDAGAGGGETVSAGDGANTISAGGAGDTLTAGNGANKITATGADATITAGNGGNTIAATGTGDSITSGSGNDTIVVTAGGATIKAGLGSNTIRFAGSDNMVYNQGGSDTLTDNGSDNTIFLPAAGEGVDTIHGNVLATDTFNLVAAMDATDWDKQPSDVGDFLTLATSGSDALVQINDVLDSAPVTVATLKGAGSVSLSDFLSHAVLPPPPI